MMKQRFFIDTEGNDDKAYQEAMVHSCKLASAYPELKQVILLIPSKNNTGWFERLYGDEVVKKLHKGTTFKDCPLLFKFESIKTTKGYFQEPTIVITCGLDTDILEKIDDSFARVIIAIPWLKDNITKWVQRWNPTELRGKTNTTAPPENPSCIVIKALQALTKEINMSTGIIHPNDEFLAKTYIRALHKYEHGLDSDAIMNFLVTNLNWETRFANDIKNLIDILNSGKSFKGDSLNDLDYYYNKWKEECN